MIDPLPIAPAERAEAAPALAELLARGKQAAVEAAGALGPTGHLSQVAVLQATGAEPWRQVEVRRTVRWRPLLDEALGIAGPLEGLALAGGVFLPGPGDDGDDPLVRLVATDTRAALRVVAVRGSDVACALAPVRFPLRTGEPWELGAWQGCRIDEDDELVALARAATG